MAIRNITDLAARMGTTPASPITDDKHPANAIPRHLGFALAIADLVEHKIDPVFMDEHASPYDDIAARTLPALMDCLMYHIEIARTLYTDSQAVQS